MTGPAERPDVDPADADRPDADQPEVDRADVDVVFEPEAQRFVARVPGTQEFAYIDVVPGTGTWTFTHTQVPARFRGQGVGSELVRQALAHVRALGASVKPVCPFTADYIRQHPEEADVVHARHRHLIE